MIRVCSSKLHKGDPVFGEKPPYKDRSSTHGFCPSCFELEMEKLEREGHVGPEWREEWREFKKNYRRSNMPKERQPREGDFVFWENETWIITKVFKRPRQITITNWKTGENDNLPIDNLAPTDIQTWEAE